MLAESAGIVQRTLGVHTAPVVLESFAGFERLIRTIRRIFISVSRLGQAISRVIACLRGRFTHIVAVSH